MEKKKSSAKSKTQDLKDRAKDRLHRYLLAEGQVRACFVRGRRMLLDMQASHTLGLLETYVLGQAYLAIALMAGDLKGEDRIACKVECDGPIRGWSVEAHAAGEVRGYLRRIPIPVEGQLESFDLTRFYGNGILTVIRYPETAKQPYSGQIELKYGNLASDLANYYLQSEQTPTAIVISIKFTPEGTLNEAAGLLIQPLPGFPAADLDRLEQTMNALPSIGDALAAGQTPDEFMNAQFAHYQIKPIGSRRVEFFCRCRKETVAEVLRRLEPDSLNEIAVNGPFPVEIRCHNCNTVFLFDQAEIETLFASRDS